MRETCPNAEIRMAGSSRVRMPVPVEIRPVQLYNKYADPCKTGETKLILESPDGEKQVFALAVGRNTYETEYAADPGG